jgi:hypothetical protein
LTKVHAIVPPPPGLLTTAEVTSISFFSCSVRSTARITPSDALPAPDAEMNST